MNINVLTQYVRVGKQPVAVATPVRLWLVQGSMSTEVRLVPVGLVAAWFWALELANSRLLAVGILHPVKKPI